MGVIIDIFSGILYAEFYVFAFSVPTATPFVFLYVAVSTFDLADFRSCLVCVVGGAVRYGFPYLFPIR